MRSRIAIDAGALRHKLDVQQNYGEDTYDSEYGQRTDDWQTAAKVHASVTALSGREAEHARQIDAQATHRIEHRYLDVLTVRHRYKMGTRYFHIGHIDDVDQRKIKHIVLAAEITPPSTS